MKELSWRERGRLWLRLGLRLVLTVLVVALVWNLGPPLLSLFMPFVLALVMAWLFNPAIRYLQKKFGMKRGPLSLVFILLAFALVGGVLAGFVYTLVSQASSFLQNWQPIWSDTLEAVNSIAQWLEDWLKPLPQGAYDQLVGLLEQLVQWLSDVVPSILTNMAGKAGSFAMGIPSWAISMVIFLMATYFISADYPHLRFVATNKLPSEVRGFCSQVKRVAVDAFGGYVKAELIVTFFIFLILLGGFLVMREPYALLIAILLGILDFIPIVGSGTVMVPWCVIDIVLGNYTHALGLAITWGIIAVFRRVAEPKVVGDQTGLSPIASLVCIYVGMQVAGVLGMILGPILTLVVVNIAKGGVFDNTMNDLRLAVRDIQAILRGSTQKNQK